MRGEHSNVLHPWGLVPGSSPHARGAPIKPTPLITAAGIIPACAGSTGKAIMAGFMEGDHPRMRGEHTNEALDLPEQTGSSPHARGALKSMWDSVTGWGIIPACAGSTPPRSGRGAPPGDHPRMRGEH